MRSGRPVDLKKTILETWAIGAAANQLLLRHMNDGVWRAPLPGFSKQKSIATIFAHLHNCRLMWLKMTGKRTGLPPRLTAAGARDSKCLQHCGAAPGPSRITSRAALPAKTVA